MHCIEVQWLYFSSFEPLSHVVWCKSFFQHQWNRLCQIFFLHNSALVCYVQISMYAQNVVFNRLKQKNLMVTMCKMYVMAKWSSPIILSLLLGQYWPWHGVVALKISKFFSLETCCLCVCCIVTMKWKIHVENKHVVIHAHSCITIVKSFSYHLM